MWLQKGEVLFSRQSEPRIGCLESELRGPQPRSDAPQFPLTYAPPSARASWKIPMIAPSWMGSPQPCFKRQSTSANATVKWSRCRTGISCWINSCVRLAVRIHVEYSYFEASQFIFHSNLAVPPVLGPQHQPVVGNLPKSLVLVHQLQKIIQRIALWVQHSLQRFQAGSKAHLIIEAMRDLLRSCLRSTVQCECNIYNCWLGTNCQYVTNMKELIIQWYGFD